MSPIPANERLESALLQLRQSRNALAELAGVWPNAQPAALWWDDHFKVFATSRRPAAYGALFGSYAIFRSLANARSLAGGLRGLGNVVSPGRWRGPFAPESPLPPDAVVIPPIASKEGIVVASQGAGTVLKVTYGRPEVLKEIENWEISKAAGIEQRVPAVMSHGRAAGEGHWMLTQFVPNTDPLDRPLNPWRDRRRTWRQWLRWSILPVMGRFYEASGLEVFTVDDLLDDARAALAKDDMPDPMFRVAELAERARYGSDQTTAVMTTIHKDIVPSHVHRDGDSWWILDWGSTGRGLTSKEVFRQYLWTLIPAEENHRAFWAWLRGVLPVQRAPAGLQADIDMYVSWYAAWRKTAMCPESLRCQLLISMLKDMHEIIVGFDLKHRLPELENLRELPRWVRCLSAQFRALGAM